MNFHFKHKTSLLLTALLALPMAHATLMGKADYTAAKTRINADYKADKADKATCASLAGNAKDICIETANGKSNIAKAERESDYTGKPADQNKVLLARAKAIYAVAREQCDAFAGNPKDVCVQQAKTNKTKALADAKLGKQIGVARKDAADDKRDADYKAEAEQCDALAGDAKIACVAQAKAYFGKA